MTAVALRFLAGRYHATPWGRHVNEGVPEWPPSPWRLLRALVSAWYTVAYQDVDEFTLVSLLEKLAAKAPQFHLPPASVGHTRHFMPWFKKGPEDPTLVFDTFVSVPRDQWVYIIWPGTDLDESERL